MTSASHIEMPQPDATGHVPSFRRNGERPRPGYALCVACFTEFTIEQFVTDPCPGRDAPSRIPDVNETSGGGA